MKKIVLLILTFAFVITGFAQVTLKLYDENDEEVSNQTHMLEADTDYYLKLENTGSSGVDVILLISDILVPQGATGIEVCYFGNCFPPTTTVGQLGSNAYTVGAGEIYYNEADKIIYHANGETGPAFVEFTFQQEGNEANSVTFTLDNQVSVDDLSSVKDVKVYPNPATERFSVKINDELIGSEIVFTNLLGKVIFTDKLDNTITDYSTDRFSNGVYFYTLMNNGMNIGTKKLIIK